MCPIFDGSGVMGIFYFPYMPSCDRVLRNQLAGDLLILVAYRLRKLQRGTRAVQNRAAGSVAAGSGIFESQL